MQLDIKKLGSGLWSGIKKWSYKWLGGLILEEKKGGELSVSLGRTLLLAVMGGMAIFWWGHFDPIVINVDEVLAKLGDAQGGKDAAMALVEAMKGQPKDLPAGMMEVFYALATYVFGGKVAGALKAKWAK